MKVLVFITVISTLNLVFADDKTAIDTSNTYQVHPDPEDIQDDQIAESSHPVSHGVVITHQKEIPKGSQNHVLVTDIRHNGQNVAQQGVHVQESLRHSSEVAQTGLNQMYAHPIYVQQYPIKPIRIIGAEASALQQVREGQNAYGYSTYVEHLSSKDEEEIQSALKEGSVGDIKRLVPKSGISFKIYHNDKTANLNVEKDNTEIHSNELPSSAPGYSAVHYKAEVPAAQFRIQSLEHQRPTIIGLEHTYTKTELAEQQPGLDNSQDLLQTVGKTDEQSANGQSAYFTHSVADSQKAFSEANEASVQVTPNYGSNLENKPYSNALATAEFNSLAASKGYGNGAGDLSHSYYQKHWSLESKLEGAQQASKNVKPFSTLQHEIDPVAQAERSKGVQHTQNQPTSYAVHNNYNNHKSIDETLKNANYISNSYVANAVSGQQSNRVYDRKMISGNRLPGSHLVSETLKTGQNHIVGHFGTNAEGNSQHFKGSQSDHYATNYYSDNEAAKSSQQNFVGHVAKNIFVETKNSQNNFDHQKALEGSTSFDIKNAIDTTGNLVHQTNFAAPSGTEAQHLEGIQKQQVAYIPPKIPTSAVLLDNAIHETPILEGHQVKQFGHGGISSPQFSYHPVSSPEVSGKFVHQPETIVWGSEQLKQRNPSDLHQPIIRLHLPRDEFYQHLKGQKVELPSSTISHISHQAHKPYVLQYDVPAVKYPQEFHFQPKIKPGIQSSQSNHIKLTQPVTIDWSLFKSAMPNFNLNSVGWKSELGQLQETGKKIVPILVRKRKNRSNSKQEIGVIYGKVNNNRRPSKPNHRQEKNVRFNLIPEASSIVNKHFEGAQGERKNEFSVSASYKVDRSFKSPNSS